MLKNKKRILPIAFSVLLVASPFLFPAISHADPTGLVPKCQGGDPIGSSGETGCGYTDLIILANNVINFLLFKLTLPIATIAFIYAGFLYMTSAGDTSKISKAHEIFRKVIIGMLIAFSAWLLVYAILKGLDVNPDFYDKIIR